MCDDTDVGRTVRYRTVLATGTASATGYFLLEATAAPVRYVSRLSSFVYLQIQSIFRQAHAPRVSEVSSTLASLVWTSAARCHVGPPSHAVAEPMGVRATLRQPRPLHTLQHTLQEGAGMGESFSADHQSMGRMSHAAPAQILRP